MNKITNDIYYIGVNDHELDLFEGQYDVPNGMAYNSYIIVDEKTAIFDTVDGNFTATCTVTVVVASSASGTTSEDVSSSEQDW